MELYEENQGMLQVSQVFIIVFVTLFSDFRIITK